MADPQTAHDVSESEQHSPLPWRIARDVWEGIEAADGTGIAMWNGIESIVPRDADAEFIVTACNSHDALVDALEQAAGILPDCDNRHGDEVLTVVRAALALAEGRK